MTSNLHGFEINDRLDLGEYNLMSILETEDVNYYEYNRIKRPNEQLFIHRKLYIKENVNKGGSIGALEGYQAEFMVYSKLGKRDLANVRDKLEADFLKIIFSTNVDETLKETYDQIKDIHKYEGENPFMDTLIKPEEIAIPMFGRKLGKSYISELISKGLINR